MAEFISTVPQVVDPMGAVAFQSTAVRGCCNIRHREGSSIVVVKGGTCCRPARYRVNFHANVTGVADAITFALVQDGEIMPETLMSVVPAAADDVWTISATAEVLVDCSCSRISVRNTGDAAVTVNTANIIVDKED